MITRRRIEMDPEDMVRLGEAIQFRGVTAEFHGDTAEGATQRVDLTALIQQHCPSARTVEYQVPADE
jgi:hypothetical protein